MLTPIPDEVGNNGDFVAVHELIVHETANRREILTLDGRLVASRERTTGGEQCRSAAETAALPRKVKVVSREHFREICKELIDTIGADKLHWASKRDERLYYRGMIVVPSDRNDVCSTYEMPCASAL